MKTTTHLILGAAVATAVKHPRFRPAAFVLGCGAPDFFIIGLFGVIISKAAVSSGETPQQGVGTFAQLYFSDPLCIAAHSLLHSPTSLLLLTLLAWSFSTGRWKDRALSFLAGSAFHSIVDIAVHHDDGPLMLWPFDWSFRIHSPVSHWDVAHFGGYVLAFEISTFLMVLLFIRTANPWRLLGTLAQLFPAKTADARQPEVQK